MRSTLLGLAAMALLSLACASTGPGGTAAKTAPAAPAAPPPPPVDPRELSATVEFETGSSSLSDTARSELDRFAGDLAPFPDQRVHVVGYSDSSGEEKRDRWLPEQRAKSVAAYLVSRGIALNHVTVEGHAADSASPDATASSARRAAEVVVR